MRLASALRRRALGPLRRAAFRRFAYTLVAVLLAIPLATIDQAPARAAAAGQRIDLRVLLVSDGSPTVEAIARELTQEHVPYAEVRLDNPSRPVITSSFLAGTAPTGPRAYYQAVVLPNAAPAGMTAAELEALAAFETTFGVRQVNAYVYPNASVGLSAPVAPDGWGGTLDGLRVATTSAGRSAGFSYLAAPVAFEDIDPTVGESFGYLAKPLPSTATQSFTTLIDGPIPGTSARGSLIGVLKQGAREQLVLTAAMNASQSHFQFLAHGLITWATRGVHLGYDRNYFSVHVDDVFAYDSRWSITGRCTPGEDCRNGEVTADIRMQSSDVDALMSYQNANMVKPVMVFNGNGSVEYAATHGSDPLLSKFRSYGWAQPWINHTYNHDYLGCIQAFEVVPWRCASDPGTGETVWRSQSDIQSEVSQNIDFARANRIPMDATELVTGEHSGLFLLPQQPTDNPNLAPALAATGIRFLGSDNSRDPEPRQVGPAGTVPRHPMSVFFNAATRAEEVSEYNWLYTSREDGGSGLCSDNPATMTCIAPLDPATGFESYIVPLEGRIDLMHILNNDPRPHFAHQSNLTEDRILYPVLDEILRRYRSVMSSTAPLVQPTFKGAGQVLARDRAWSDLPQGSFSAYTLNGWLTVEASAGTVNVPITVPLSTRVSWFLGTLFGERYAGERSAWASIRAGRPLNLLLPG